MGERATPRRAHRGLEDFIVIKAIAAISRMTGTGIIAAGLLLSAPIQADETPGGDMRVRTDASVTAAPPAFVKLDSTSLAAGIGISWGKGTLVMDGERHGFSVSGVSLGDVGISTMNATGAVENLENLADFAGNYLAVEAGATLGIGASTIRLRNDKGVVLALTSKRQGVQLTLAAEGVRISLD